MEEEKEEQEEEEEEEEGRSRRRRRKRKRKKVRIYDRRCSHGGALDIGGMVYVSSSAFYSILDYGMIDYED
ncbi:hypothetical protein BZA77DRAFT_353874 [Pyronema omphalodes]|nr:hypothetical protein BZA77DRAFT_353874 [Pyronema omphalodes]